jgi:hypothetical protein
MAIRNLRHGCAALAVGILLLSGASLAARAGDSDDCDECDQSRWQRFCNWCNSDHSCRCKHCHRCKNACRGNCRCMKALNVGYVDPRDTELYSAQGYDIPVAVPLAPVVKHTYNYGWGVPSSRLTRVGARYEQWHPNTPFSQSGSPFVGGVYPMVYQPTDTTQQGFYYVHVPRWGRYGAW